jgi:hypothetical protein
MKIIYPSAQPTTLCYDGAFTVHTFEDKPYQLEEILETVEGDFGTYGFDECAVINAKTGEIIAIILNE